MLGQKGVQRVEVATYHDMISTGVVGDWSCAIDGGAHVGTWAAAMAAHFETVLAYEPTPESFSMLVHNMADYPNVVSRNEALLHKPGRVSVLKPRPKRETLTARYVQWDKRGDTRCVTIDDLQLPSCGLIKLDLEGAEYLALQGARKTIKRCRPVLIVEVWDLCLRFGKTSEEVQRFILKFGYREVFRRGVDRVYATV